MKILSNTFRLNKLKTIIVVEVKQNGSMKFPKQLITGVLKTIVFKMISDYKKIHGYDIIQKVKLLTNDKIQITEGAIYPILHSLETKGYLNTEIEFKGKRQRKYYILSTKGEIEATIKLNEMNDFIETLNQLLIINNK